MKILISILLALSAAAPAQTLMRVQRRTAASSVYSYQRTWTAGNTTQVPSAQTNFTFEICGNGSGACSATFAGFNQSGAGAHVSNASGYDIVFSTTSCAGGAAPTLMNWTWYGYSASTGEFHAKVKKGTLTAGDGIYICYGNASITTFQGGAATSAFDTNTAAYYTQEDNAGSTAVSDISGHGNGMNSARNTSVLSTSGQISLGLTNTNSNSDYILLASDPTNPKIYGATATYEMWFKPTSVSSQQGLMQSADSANDGGPQFIVQNNSGMLRFHSGSSFHDVASVTVNTWNHMVFSIRASTGGDDPHCNVWLNGTAFGDLCPGESVAGGYFSGVTSKLWLGSGYPAYSDAIFDELVIYTNRQTSDDWVTARYKNGLAPNTFGTIGSEVAL